MITRLRSSALLFSLLFLVELNGQAVEKQAIQPSVKYFYHFPSRVNSVITNSIVSVESYIVSVRADGAVVENNQSGTGFVVRKNWVMTSYHVLATEPSQLSDISLAVRVYDGHSFFPAKVIAIDFDDDLVILEVTETDLNNPKIIQHFNKTPVTFATKNDIRRMPRNFYTFRRFPGQGVYSPLRLGEYLAESNYVNRTSMPVIYGQIQGQSEHGFSGGPLIGPSGRVYGIPAITTEAFTYVVILNNVTNFLAKTEKFFADEKKKSKK